MPIYKSTLVAILLCLLLFPFTNFGQSRTLDYYIDQGLKNSPLLKEYANQLSSLEFERKLIKANYVPQVSIVTNNSVSPVINGKGYDETITNTGNYSTVLSANKTFVGPGNLTTQLKAVDLQNDSSVINSKISEQDLRRTITNQFITAYGEQQQLLNNERISKLLQQEDVILKKLTQNNIYRQTDYLTFLVTLKQQDLQLRQLRIQYQTDFANLNYVCGLFDTSANETTLKDPGLILLPLPDPYVSIYFKKYLVDSLRLQNEMSLINLNYRPKLNVFGDAGYMSTQFYSNPDNLGFSVGLNASVPIFDGHRRRFNLQKIRLLEDTRMHYASFFKVQYDQLIAQYMQQLRSTEALVADIQEQVNYTEGLIDVNKKLLQTGDVKISDFVIAINNYLTAQYLITQNRIGLLQIINQINYYSR